MTFFAADAGGDSDAGGGEGAKRPRRRGSRGDVGGAAAVRQKFLRRAGTKAGRQACAPGPAVELGRKPPVTLAAPAPVPIEDVPVASPGDLLEEQTHDFM